MSDEHDEIEPAEAPEAPEAQGRGLGPMFTPGGRPGPGRPKGRANGTTIVLREAISTVFLDLQAGHPGGGEFPHFRAWATDNPTDFYKMAVRALPIRIEATGQAIAEVVFHGMNAPKKKKVDEPQDDAE